MKDIYIVPQNSHHVLLQFKEALGGNIEEQWGEYKLIINSQLAFGCIRYIGFEKGISLFEFDLKFFEDTTIKLEKSDYNPIQFLYCLSGQLEHKFETDKAYHKIGEFQSIITSRKVSDQSYYKFKKGINTQLNIIQVVRVKFLKKRFNKLSNLNKDLYQVFLDTDNEKNFAYYDVVNLKMADWVKKLKSTKNNSMLKVLQLEGMVYQILFNHINEHDKVLKDKTPDTHLLKKELKIIKQLGEKIVKNVSKDYKLNQLASETGLSQAKLQEGFKVLYARTVTEYIRHVRLQAARDLIQSSDSNISEVVYAIGFSSRSYFSKIFKEKYNISPSQFKRAI